MDRTTKYINLEYHSVCSVPSSKLGLPHPLSRKWVCPSHPRNQREGGGTHSPVYEGVGESQFGQLEKKLSTLPSLWIERYPQIGQNRVLYRIQRKSTKLTLQSSTPLHAGDCFPPPPFGSGEGTLVCGRGGGGSQFQRGDRHFGTHVLWRVSYGMYLI